MQKTGLNLNVVRGMINDYCTKSSKYRDLPVTNKSRYFATTEFKSVAEFVCFGFYFNEYLPLCHFHAKRRKKEISVVSFTHEQNISWTTLRMSRTLFASAKEKGEKFACNYNDDDLLGYGNFL